MILERNGSIKITQLADLHNPNPFLGGGGGGKGEPVTDPKRTRGKKKNDEGKGIKFARGPSCWNSNHTVTKNTRT